jgi:hypothetical protein
VRKSEANSELLMEQFSNTKFEVKVNHCQYVNEREFSFLQIDKKFCDQLFFVF